MEDPVVTGGNLKEDSGIKVIIPLDLVAGSVGEFSV